MKSSEICGKFPFFFRVIKGRQFIRAHHIPDKMAKRHQHAPADLKDIQFFNERKFLLFDNYGHLVPISELAMHFV
jgi:hypothetical protein